MAETVPKAFFTSDPSGMRPSRLALHQRERHEPMQHLFQILF
jgi:hypothetical protein